MIVDEPLFLDVEDVVENHATQLAVYGGSGGLRDRGLLESAVAQPRMSFGGEYVQQGLFAMAAAYLFHLVSIIPSWMATSAQGCSLPWCSSMSMASPSIIHPRRSTN